MKRVELDTRPRDEYEVSRPRDEDDNRLRDDDEIAD